jgi:nicotinamidase-related amidase
MTKRSVSAPWTHSQVFHHAEYIEPCGKRMVDIVNMVCEQLNKLFPEEVVDPNFGAGPFDEGFGRVHYSPNEWKWEYWPGAGKNVAFVPVHVVEGAEGWWIHVDVVLVERNEQNKPNYVYYRMFQGKSLGGEISRCWSAAAAVSKMLGGC